MYVNMVPKHAYTVNVSKKQKELCTTKGEYLFNFILYRVHGLCIRWTKKKTTFISMIFRSSYGNSATTALHFTFDFTQILRQF